MSELSRWSPRFVCLFAVIGLLSADSVGAQEQDGKLLVAASLISDINSIQPGQKFRIGVLYRIEPGWHIYWKYPGDAGMPTKIAWQLPEGFRVHDLQWPIPTREKEPGDLEVFAYSSEVLLFAEVEAPQSLPDRPIDIQAKSDWLVCENFCIPGSAQLSLKMNAGVSIPSQSAPIFEKYIAKLPQTLPAKLRIGFDRTGKNLGITVAGAPIGDSIDFFPLAPAGAVIGRVTRIENQLSIPIDTGYASSFFQGVFATILATPCTAPFLGTASAFAFAPPGWVTFLVFVFVGFGMASPYLVLAINPNWLRYLPKPGGWMVRLKQSMGFLLIATLLWLAWILGQMKGANAVISLGAILMVIAILAWIKGSFWTPISSPRSRILAGAAMLLVIVVAAGVDVFVTQPSHLAWQHFSRDSLENALTSGRPVFVDFTADWCIACKANERFAIDTPQVRQEFSKRNVVLLQADWTNGDPEITQILKQHGRAGVPMYLVYPGRRRDQGPVVLPELITSQAVLEALDRT
jgi:DsbC/DsbD-like thiol-disulfide interchange protein